MTAGIHPSKENDPVRCPRGYLESLGRPDNLYPTLMALGGFVVPVEAVQAP